MITISTHPSMTAPASSFSSRMLRSMKLDPLIYEEVEHDPNASRQAFYVIGLVSVCQAIGVGLTHMILGESLTGIVGGASFGFIVTIVGLAIWSYLVYFFGTRLFKGAATFQETWRCAGFARSPGVFFTIPFIGFIVNIWLIAAQVVAARQALDITTGKAIITCIVSFLPYIFLLAIVESILLLFL